MKDECWAAAGRGAPPGLSCLGGATWQFWGTTHEDSATVGRALDIRFPCHVVALEADIGLFCGVFDLEADVGCRCMEGPEVRASLQRVYGTVTEGAS